MPFFAWIYVTSPLHDIPFFRFFSDVLWYRFNAQLKSMLEKIRELCYNSTLFWFGNQAFMAWFNLPRLSCAYLIYRRWSIKTYVVIWTFIAHIRVKITYSPMHQFITFNLRIRTYMVMPPIVWYYLQ